MLALIPKKLFKKHKPETENMFKPKRKWPKPKPTSMFHQFRHIIPQNSQTTPKAKPKADAAREEKR